jgi:hypothetical protein
MTPNQAKQVFAARAKEETAKKLHVKISRWLKDNNLDYGVSFYSPLEWLKRGEKYGENSVLNITGDGADLFDALNAGYEEGGELDEKFTEFLNGLGYWYELGYSWSIHIFPREGGLGDLPQSRPLNVIAAEIRRDWKNVNYAAAPYLQAMAQMGSIKDNYGMDDGKGIVLYFLGNASSWRGDTAKRVKAELKKMAGVR